MNASFYTMPRSMGCYRIPLTFQSIILREYAAKKDITFALPITEWCFRGNYHALAKLLRGDSSSIVMVTAMALIELPLIYSTWELLTNSDKNFHFILEREILKGYDASDFVKTLLYEYEIK